jgi:hypothetical protein
LERAAESKFREPAGDRAIQSGGRGRPL